MNKIFKNLYLFVGFVLLVCLTESVIAQIKLVPNQTTYKKTHKSSKTHHSLEKSRSLPLALPFFDDFSSNQTEIDTTFWLKNSGAYLNRTLGVNPISYGVVSFDALNQFGSPYRFSTVVEDAIGLSDTLVSQIINLSTLNPSDSLYLSFYWQREGLGETPDLVDSLRLQAKDKDGNWLTLWSMTGGSTNPFTQVLIPITDARFFYNKFQFQFQSFGRLSGAYDVWHIDYVYLNSGRNYQDFSVEDITISNRPNFFLKTYTAMPISQFFANPSNEINPEIKSSINSLKGSGFDFVPFKSILYNSFTNSQLAVLKDSSIFLPAGTQQFVLNAKPSLNLNLPKLDSLALEVRFIADTQDDAITIPSYDLRMNDTLSSVSILNDYYAYDDGSAEYGAGINQRFGKVAVKFQLNEKDTLTDVQFEITKFEKDLTGQTFNLTIWKEIGGFKDSVLYKVSVPVRYADKRNQLLSVSAIKKLTDSNFKFQAIPIEGTFYVGWEQTTNDRLTFGFDRNTDSANQIFFNVGNQWNAWQAADNERGSLLLRPVFGKGTVVTGVEEEISTNFKIYPNPANQYLNLSGSILKEIKIYDLLGNLVFSQNSIPTDNDTISLPISHFSNGIYILQATHSNRQISRHKIVINK